MFYDYTRLTLSTEKKEERVFADGPLHCTFYLFVMAKLMLNYIWLMLKETQITKMNFDILHFSILFFLPKTTKQ